MYICNLEGIFVQEHKPMMGNICIPVLLVTLLITVNSYMVDILTAVSCIHEAFCICGIYVAFEGHISYWHTYDNSMINKVSVC